MPCILIQCSGFHFGEKLLKIVCCEAFHNFAWGPRVFCGIFKATTVEIIVLFLERVLITFEVTGTLIG